MISMIALDLDGTLLRSDGSISEETIDKLECLHETGIVVVVATGRSYIGLPQNIRCLSFVDYLISSNGTTVTRWDDNSIIYREWMPKDLSYLIFKECSNLDIIIDTLVDGTWHIDAHKYKKYNFILNNNVKKYIEKTRVMEDDYDFFLNTLNKGTEKIVMNFDPSNEIIKNKISYLSQCYPVNIWSDKKHKLDIISEKASKGNALKWLANFLKIEDDTIIAFGNDDNDISMMKEVGIPVAVSNATGSLKDSTKYITVSNDQDGVLQYLRKVSTLTSQKE